MNRYLLDTNVLSDLIKNPTGRVFKKLKMVGDANVCTSIIVAAELRFGCQLKGSSRLTEIVEQILGEISILPFESPADREYAMIRMELKAAGTPIGGNDLFIAAHAKAVGAAVVTANIGEFGRVAGLQVENWLG